MSFRYVIYWCHKMPRPYSRSDVWLSIETWWNDTDSKNPSYSGGGTLRVPLCRAPQAICCRGIVSFPNKIRNNVSRFKTFTPFAVWVHLQNACLLNFELSYIINLSVCLSVRPSSVRPAMYPSVCPSVPSVLRLFVCPSERKSTHISIHTHTRTIYVLMRGTTFCSISKKWHANGFQTGYLKNDL